MDIPETVIDRLKLLFQVHSLRNDHSKLFEISRAITETAPYDFDNLLEFSKICFKLRKFEDLLKYFNDASNLYDYKSIPTKVKEKLSECLEYIYRASKSFFDTRDYDNALRYLISYSELSNSESIDNEIIDKAYEIGTALLDAKSYLNAKTAYLKCYELASEHYPDKSLLSDLEKRIGDCLYELGEYSESVRYYADSLHSSQYPFDSKLLEKIQKAGDKESETNIKIGIYQLLIELFADIKSNYVGDEGVENDCDRLKIPTLKKLGGLHLFSREYEKTENTYLEILEASVKLNENWNIFRDIGTLVGKYIENKQYKKAQTLYKKVQRIKHVDDKDFEKITEMVIDIEKRKTAEERERLLKIFSHNIKNALIKIRAPLENYQNELKEKEIEFPKKIKGALKKLNDVENIANSINFSLSGTTEDFIFDSKFTHDGKTLNEIIGSSIETSIEKMLDEFGIYSAFSKRYFPDLNHKKEARNFYFHSLKGKSLRDLKYFIDKFFLDLFIETGTVGEYLIGNRRHSLTKFTILFDELIFNAIKYSSLVKRDRRYLSITASANAKSIIFNFKNSFDPLNQSIKTTRIGNEVIAGIVDILKGEYSHERNKEDYIVKINFLNFWEICENEQDSIH